MSPYSPDETRPLWLSCGWFSGGFDFGIIEFEGSDQTYSTSPSTATITPKEETWRRTLWGAGQIKSSRFGAGSIYCTCVWVVFGFHVEKIMLDAIDGVHNGEKTSQHLNFMWKLLARGARWISNGIAGAKRVKSISFFLITTSDYVPIPWTLKMLPHPPLSDCHLAASSRGGSSHFVTLSSCFRLDFGACCDAVYHSRRCSTPSVLVSACTSEQLDIYQMEFASRCTSSQGF